MQLPAQERGPALLTACGHRSPGKPAGLTNTYHGSQEGTDSHFCSVSQQNTESDKKEVPRETSEQD